jgi:hypothetical protein
MVSEAFYIYSIRILRLVGNNAGLSQGMLTSLGIFGRWSLESEGKTHRNAPANGS